MTHFDRLETRTPKIREAALFRDLAAALAIAKNRAPALRRQLRGFEPQHIRSRAALARLPVLRKSDLKNCRKMRRRLADFQPPAWRK